MFNLIRKAFAKRQDKRVQQLMQDPELRQAVERLVYQVLSEKQGVVMNAEPDDDGRQGAFW